MSGAMTNSNKNVSGKGPAEVGGSVALREIGILKVDRSVRTSVRIALGFGKSKLIERD
jgi:hypothetical protein